MKSIYFIGDVHRKYDKLSEMIVKNDLRNSSLIQVGDFGMGINPEDFGWFCALELLFQERNLTFYIVRGNHDCPYYFDGQSSFLEKHDPVFFRNKHLLKHFVLVSDYSVLEIESKKIFFLGGAISLDRDLKTKNVSYWEEEIIDYSADKIPSSEVDIVVTHAAPDFCYPIKRTFEELKCFFRGVPKDLFGSAKDDFKEELHVKIKILQEQVKKERDYLDRVFHSLRPSNWFYGHYHKSKTEYIEGCKFKLLAELEVSEFFIDE